MKRALQILVLLFVASRLNAQTAVIDGNWWGKIDFGTQTLSIGFEIINGEGKVLMDVPEQGAIGIPATLKKATSDSLEIDISAIGASYMGVRESDELITGSFNQNGMVLKLDLQPGKIMMVRSQTPRPPYPYITEEVSFENKEGGAILKGTLTYPMMHFRYPSGTIPVVLMVTGSGGQNRDEEVFDHKPFAVLAHHLALNGIASLRYDDRGVGESTGPTEGTTTFDNKADAAAGISFLRELGKFGKTGILGHSEGGTIAFMLGGEGVVDFAVSMAGAAAKGIDVMLGQNAAVLKLQGIPDALADQYCSVLEIVFRDRIAGYKVDDPAGYTEEICSRHGISLPVPLKSNLEQVAATGGEWITWFLGYDPADAIKKIHCPLFALNGSNDLQVISRDNLDVIRKNLPPNDKSLIKEYDSLNHLFQHCSYQNSLNYYAIDETISQEVLKDVSDWINSIK